MSWLDGISFMVSDDAKAVKNVGSAVGAVAGAAGNTAAPGGGAPPAGQGFNMDKDAMKTLLDKCKQARDDIHQQFSLAEGLSQALPPGHEPASQQAVGDQVKGVNASGSAYYTALKNQHAYFNELVNKMEDALGLHRSNDEDVAQTVNSKNGMLG